MLKILIGVFYLFFGYQSIGLPFAGYNFTISTIAFMLIMPIAFLSNLKIKRNLFFAIFLFVLWCFLGSITRFSFTPSLLSLVLLLFLIFPITIILNKSNFQDIDKYVFFGLILIIPFVFYDLGVSFLGFTPLEDRSVFFENTNSNMIFDFYRVKATFDEPSYLAIYLDGLLYYFLNVNSKYRKNAIIIILLIIPITFSLTGIFLTIVIFILKYIKSFWKLLLSFVVILSISLTSSFYSEFFSGRMYLVYDSLIGNNISGSEGSRINSIIVMLDYLKQSNTLEFFFGEGYGKYDSWLIEKYKFFNKAMVSYARGQINNTIAIVGISTGVVGLFLYFNIFFRLIRDGLLSSKSLFIQMLIQFCFGFLVSSMFWGILLLFMMIPLNKSLKYEK